MAAYNIYEAKTGFSAQVEKAVKGEEVVIAKANRPVAKLVPISEPAGESTRRRRRPAPGSMGGDLSQLLKMLDEPWSEEEQFAFGMID